MKQFLFDMAVVAVTLMILAAAGFAIRDLLTNAMYAFNLGH